MQKRTFYILFIVFLISDFSIGQSNSKTELKLTEYDSLLHTRIYTVKIDDYQVVELMEFNSGEFDGTLINAVWKTNRDESKAKLISQKIKIPSSTVKKLMYKLKEEDFEILPNCNDVKGCIQGNDGNGIAFSVINKKSKREYYYWEPESDYYYTNEKMIPEVLKVREILKTINAEFNLLESEKAFRSKLPKGKYTFGMIIMEKK